MTGITALLGRAHGLRVVDPNLRPGLWGSSRAVELVGRVIAASDLVMGGQAELRAFAPDRSLEDLARAVSELGPREVVVKMGSRGAAALDREGRWHEHPSETPGPDVDPVGAGDAFNAGYLAARLADPSVSDALAEGARCGAAVAATVGDTEGSLRTSADGGG